MNARRAADARSTLSCMATDLLRAAFGVETAARGQGRWPTLYALAVQHRLAPLVWVRSGQRIVAESPDAARAWRAAYLAATANAHAQLRTQGELRDCLLNAGVAPVVLKGAPLAAQLHGDAAVRVSDDIDLYIAAPQRAAASRALSEAGWVSDTGRAPDDEMFRRHDGERVTRVEIHSTLAPSRLGHLPVPAPEAVAVTIAGVTLEAFTGPLVAGYLAGHLATHNFPPLLWWVDFTTLWQSLTDAERRAARAAADRAGLVGYLTWACRRAGAIRRVLEGDEGAMRSLGFAGDRRTEPHQLWRHLAAAGSLHDAARVAQAWARPGWAPTRDGGPVAGTLRRLERHWRLLLPLREERPGGSSTVPRREGTLSAQQLLVVAREVPASGGEFWLALTGDSMAPTLRRGDRLLLGAPRVRRGAIVLADLAGRPVVHRVLRVADQVLLRGDGCQLSDPPVDASRVLATVLVSDRDGSLTVHWPTWRFGFRPVTRGVVALARLAASRLRRFVRGWRVRPAARSVRQELTR